MEELPEQVRKQEEESQKLWDQQHGNTAPEATPEVEEPEILVETPVIPESSDFKHKYDVLQGKYDSELPRMSAENKQLRDHTIELSQVISTLQSEVEKLKETPAVEPEPPQGMRESLSEEEVAEIESVMDFDVFDKIVGKFVKNRTQPLEQNIASLQTTRAQSAEDVFYGKINAITDLQAINTSQEFNEWLDLKAPYTHQTRRTILKAAESNLDADTVCELFGDYAKKPGKQTLKPRISPGKGVSTTGVPAEGKIWTAKEVSDFYVNVQKGKYNGKETERKQTERDIWNAQIQGRIQKT